MTYILNSNFSSNSRHSPWKKIGILGALAGVTVLLFVVLGGFLGNVTSGIFAPLLHVRNTLWQKVVSGTEFLTPQASLIAENEALRQQVIDLQNELLMSSQAGKRSEQNAPVTLPLNWVASSVLSLPPRTPYDTVIIDKGSEFGLQIGNPVFLSEYIEVGTIESTTDKTSQIRLFSSADTKTTVVSNRTGENIEIIGSGGGNFIVELPLDFDIQKGDLFALPGATRTVIAKVENIHRSESSTFLKVILVIPVKITGNSILYVER